VRVALQGAGHVHAGEAVPLTFRLEEVATGEPLRDLHPYLGAAAHVVVIAESGATFAHTHGEAHPATPPAGATPTHGGAPDAHGGAPDAHGGTPDAHGTPPGAFGPEIEFHHTFPAPGRYKVWGQFQTSAGEVVTADFVVYATEPD
jgi:Cu+-exporting ATPase